ncbi:hypothetical protein CS542_06225 [Pedobacter sp. IW39]|nr:hypothetical protein CS542_06225 [Pedobacter sp. IW39]
MYKDQAYTDLNQEADSVFKGYETYREVDTELSNTLNITILKQDPRFISFVSGFAVQTPLEMDIWA